MPRPRRTPGDNPVDWLLAGFDTSGGPEACHPWTRGLNTDGYGQMGSQIPGIVTKRAHRAAWILVHGPVPSGMELRHLCNNRKCGNLAHLAIGTPKDNADDRAKAGRHAVGMKCGRSNLTDSDVITIRQRVAAGETQRVVALDYGVSQPTVSTIVRRQTWAHLP